MLLIGMSSRGVDVFVPLCQKTSRLDVTGTEVKHGIGEGVWGHYLSTAF